MRRWLCVFVAVFVFSPAAQAAAAIDELAQRLGKLQSLQAQFVQTTRGKQTQEQSLLGELVAKKPGQFRWVVRQPYQQTIVSDGQLVRIYDPDLEQLLVKPLGQSWGETPALLFSGKADELKKQFTAVRHQQGVQVTYTLKPRAKDAMFNELVLAFNGTAPSQLSLRDASGTQTDVKFYEVKYNPVLTNSLFNFVPPKGTDIIHEQ